jgi:predicted GNAT superfamily acetyltransferase
MTNGLVIRKCQALEDFHRCVALQREIWQESDLEIEPATLFVVAANTGGQVLGAFDGERLVGYTLAVAGIRNGIPYLHSHMTGVHAAYRDRGVGRLLKLFQRDEALSRGIRLICWTFDPLELRNAHFNLNRLGAICRTYLPNFYGVTTSPLHRGIETDRLLAEWHLDSPRVLAAVAGAPVPDPRYFVEIPVNLQMPQELTAATASALSLLRAEFLKYFHRAYAVVALRTAPGSRAYVLCPWSDF